MSLKLFPSNDALFGKTGQTWSRPEVCLKSSQFLSISELMINLLNNV